MSFLLDTNVISEWTKPRPEPAVITWLAEVDEDRVFVSVITLGELRYGIERLSPGRRRARLEEWLRHDLVLRFEDRILPINAAVAEVWGAILARVARVGHPIGAVDALIAATAEAHALTLVTRNASDFRSALTAVFDPWKDVT